MATFATWNPSDKHASVVLSNGNLTASSGVATWHNVRSTISQSSGKWYWEYTCTFSSADVMCAIGKSTASLGGSGSTFPGGDGSGYGYHTSGNKYNSGSGVAYGATYATTNIISVALDMDAGTLIFYKNGASQGTAYTGITGTLYAMIGLDASSGQNIVANFGASPFTYTPPAGYSYGLSDVPVFPSSSGFFNFF